MRAQIKKRTENECFYQKNNMFERLVKDFHSGAEIDSRLYIHTEHHLLSDLCSCSVEYSCFLERAQ